jgi:hypothetical protein
MNEKKCRNCEQTGISELSDRVAKLEKTKDKKGEKEQGKWNQTMMRIAFYGAVASGITAICQLLIMVISFFKK